MATIVEEPCQGVFRIGQNNQSIPRQFRIEGATSKYEAYNALQNIGVDLGVPYQDSYSGAIPDSLLLATDIAIKPEVREIAGGSGSYVATVTYTRDVGTTPHGLRLEPDGPAIFYSEMSLSQEDCDVDNAGKPVLNTAGVPYTNPIQKPVPEETIIAEWIASNWTFANAILFSRQFWGKLNSDIWYGAKPGCVLCMGLKPRALDMNCFIDGGLMKFSAKFGYRSLEERTWYLMPGKTSQPELPGFIARRFNMGTSLINADYSEEDPVKEKWKPIMVGDKDDDNRTKATTPMLIDLDGENLIEPEDDPIVLGWEVIGYVEFSGLGI